MQQHWEDLQDKWESRPVRQQTSTALPVLSGLSGLTALSMVCLFCLCGLSVLLLCLIYLMYLAYLDQIGLRNLKKHVQENSKQL